LRKRTRSKRCVGARFIAPAVVRVAKRKSGFDKSNPYESAFTIPGHLREDGDKMYRAPDKRVIIR